MQQDHNACNRTQWCCYYKDYMCITMFNLGIGRESCQSNRYEKEVKQWEINNILNHFPREITHLVFVII